MRGKIAGAAEAIDLIQSSDTFCTSGFGGICTPDAATSWTGAHPHVWPQIFEAPNL